MDDTVFMGRFFDSLRAGRIRRSSKGVGAGVLAGAADSLGMSATLPRAAMLGLSLTGGLSFAVTEQAWLLILGGLAVALYGVAWMLLPNHAGRIHLEEAIKGHFNPALAISAALLVAGVGLPAVLLAALGLTLPSLVVGLFQFALLLFILAVAASVVFLIFRFFRRNKTSRPLTPADSDLLEPEGELPAPLPVYRKAPSRRRSPGPGWRAITLAIASLFLAPTIVLLGWQSGVYVPTYPPVAMAALATVLLGVLLTVLAIMGRRGGFVSFIASVIVIGGLALASITYDKETGPVLAWGETSELVSGYRFTITSLEQFDSVDWDAVSAAPWSEIIVDMPEIDEERGVDIALPAHTSMVLSIREDLAYSINLTGSNTDIFGPFETGKLDTANALGSAYEGAFSLAQGGSLQWSPSALSKVITFNIDAPSSSLTINPWRK